MLIGCSNPASTPPASTPDPSGALADGGGNEDSTPPASTSSAPTAPTPPAPCPFHLSSPAIVNGKLSTPYDARGQIVFPDLQWGKPPSGTKSFLLIMENRSGDTLAWYCGAMGPDKRGLSRGDFEALQNKAGISWTDVSKASSKVLYKTGKHASSSSGSRTHFLDTLPSKTHQFMAFSPGSLYNDTRDRGGLHLKTEFEYRITLFALKLNLEDWAGDWGNSLLSLLPSIKQRSFISDLVILGTGVPSKFQKMLGNHVIDSKELTFRASC